MTNIEKANRLKAARIRLGYNQEQMGNALNLEKSYISQLENGHRPVDASYVQRAEEFVAGINKSNEIKEAFSNLSHSQIRNECHTWLDRILDNCFDNEYLLSLVLDDLKRKFKASNSTSGDAGEELLNEGAASVPDPSQSSRHSPEAGAPNAPASPPAPVSYKGSKARPAVPKKAPK